MSASIPNSFITQWSGEFKAAYDQSESMLRSTVRVVNNVTGDTYKFHKIGSANAVDDKPRGAVLVPSNVAMGPATAYLTTAHASDTFQALDLPQTNTDTRRGLTNAVVTAINKRFDARIINALATTSNSVTSGDLTKANLIKLKKELDKAKAPRDNRFLVVHPGAVEDVLNDTAITNRDYVEQTYMNTGKLPNLFGFQIIELVDYTLLPVETANKRTCFAYHGGEMGSLGLAIGSDVQFEIERLAASDEWQVMAKMLAGAAAIDTSAIIRFEVAE